MTKYNTVICKWWRCKICEWKYIQTVPILECIQVAVAVGILIFLNHQNKAYKVETRVYPVYYDTTYDNQVFPGFLWARGLSKMSVKIHVGKSFTKCAVPSFKYVKINHTDLLKSSVLFCTLRKCNWSVNFLRLLFMYVTKQNCKGNGSYLLYKKLIEYFV